MTSSLLLRLILSRLCIYNYKLELVLVSFVLRLLILQSNLISDSFLWRTITWLHSLLAILVVNLVYFLVTCACVHLLNHSSNKLVHICSTIDSLTHYVVVLRIFQYLKDTIFLDLHFSAQVTHRLTVHHWLLLPPWLFLIS